MVEAICNDIFPFHFRNRKAIIGLTKQQFSFLSSHFNLRFFCLQCFSQKRNLEVMHSS